MAAPLFPLREAQDNNNNNTVTIIIIIIIIMTEEREQWHNYAHQFRDAFLSDLEMLVSCRIRSSV